MKWLSNCGAPRCVARQIVFPCGLRSPAGGICVCVWVCVMDLNCLLQVLAGCLAPENQSTVFRSHSEKKKKKPTPNIFTFMWFAQLCSPLQHFCVLNESVWEGRGRKPRRLHALRATMAGIVSAAPIIRADVAWRPRGLCGPGRRCWSSDSHRSLGRRGSTQGGGREGFQWLVFVVFSVWSTVQSQTCLSFTQNTKKMFLFDKTP